MILAFNHVNKSYENGKWIALHDVHFRMEKGEFLFFTGPSGAGKTTLLKLIYMEERPDSGEVMLSFGKDLTYRSGETSPAMIQRLRQKLGIVFQDFRMLTDRDVFENVAFALRVCGYSNKHIRKRVYEVLSLTGIAHKARHYPHQLSGGEQQRAAIARAMANEPYILVADEPTGNLDPEMSLEILRLFKGINAMGTTVLMATHDLLLMQGQAYGKLVLSQGKITNRNYI